MKESFFKRWVGPHFDPDRILLVSESCYDWSDDEGNLYSPQSTHPEDSIIWNIDNFGKNKYFTQMNRAVCGTRKPSASQMHSAWDHLAYSIYVQESVGQGARTRPTPEHWSSARSTFPTMLEAVRPLKVLVTGVEAWKNMPDCPLWLLADLQAYKLLDGQLVWCLALPHPANSTTGFNVERVSQSIAAFRASRFPKTESEFAVT